MAQWDDRIDTWLALGWHPGDDPLPTMRQAGLLTPVPDYTILARTKAALVQRTGLLGVGGIWGGCQLVFRHFIQTFGTPAQQGDYAGRVLAVAISEPQVGAHPKLLTTQAEADGQGFRITGQKAWVSNGPSADAIIVFAITAQDRKRKRYGAFLVPHDAPGLSMSDMPGFHALRPSRHCLLTLDACRVNASALLGEMGTAYDRMARPFRDIEDAVGSFGTLGAFRHALSLFAGATSSEPDQTSELGAIVALTAVFEAGATSLVTALDQGRFRDGDATLVGLRLLATDITARLRTRCETAGPDQKRNLLGIIADLDATLSIARGPRLARQARLGEAVIQQGMLPP